MLRTVAVAVMVSVSTGLAGVHDEDVTVRSGFGAGVPRIWNSAAWPDGAPELVVMRSCTSAMVALTGMVTVLPVAGSKLYTVAGEMLLNVVADCSRPSTWMVWVRGPHEASGFSLTTMELTTALAPRLTVSVAG